jgi:hypothetical protein
MCIGITENANAESLGVGWSYISNKLSVAGSAHQRTTLATVIKFDCINITRDASLHLTTTKAESLGQSLLKLLR